MKKLLVIAFGLLIASALTVSAAEEGKKKEMTPEQQKVQKEMLDKYDTSKDGKLDKEERAKVSEADKAKMKEAGVMQGGGKKKQ